MNPAPVVPSDLPTHAAAWPAARGRGFNAGLACALALALALAGCAADLRPPSGPAPSGLAPSPAPRPVAQAPYAGELPAFARNKAEVEANYRWAATNRAILQYFPCTCGCETEGHTSNWNCYVKEEKPGGEYVWDPMSAG